MSAINNICPRCTKGIPQNQLVLGEHDCGLKFDPKDFEITDVKCFHCEKPFQIRTIPEIYFPMHGKHYSCDNCDESGKLVFAPLDLDKMDSEDAESALAHPF